VLRFRILDIVYRSAEEIGCDHRRMEIQAAGLDVRADSDCKEMVSYCIMQ